MDVAAKFLFLGVGWVYGSGVHHFPSGKINLQEGVGIITVETESSVSILFAVNRGCGGWVGVGVGLAWWVGE